MERDIQSSEPEAPVGPDERGGHGERTDEDVSRQSGGGFEGTAGSGGEGSERSDAPDADAGGRAHTSAGEGHPAGTGERSDRDVGGPVADRDAPEDTGGATGTRQTPGQDPHS